MRLRKYAVVRHACRGQSKLIGIHELLNDYYWEALDGQHVLLVAHYPAMHHAQLDAHPDVFLLPSLQTNITLAEHALDRDKIGFLFPLAAIGVNGTHTAGQAVAIAARAFGVRFEPEV